MTHVDRAFYLSGDDEVPADEDVSTFRMDASVVVFACPICGAGQRHQSEPSPPSDERHICTSCGNGYFIFPVQRKGGEKQSKEERVETQLRSVELLYSLALRRPRRLRKVGFAVLYGATATLPVLLGLSTNIVLILLLFNSVGVTVGSLLALLFIVAQSGAAAVGGIVGPFVFLYNSVALYRELGEPDVSYVDFLEHVGNYYHNDPYSFEQ